MAALGTVTLRNGAHALPAKLAITKYTITRGRFLGIVTERSALIKSATKITPITNYIVRQITVVYRQLWPTHGQRFPQ